MTYTHRNGEAEQPAIVGLYWFDGIDNGHNFSSGTVEIKDIVSVSEIDDIAANGQSGKSILVNIPTTGCFECGYDARASSMIGRWWGPIDCPWENDL